MNTLAEFRVPAENFALYETLSETGVSFEAERITAHDSDRVIPLLWAAGELDKQDELETALRSDTSTKDVELVTDLDEERLYKMEWVKDVRFVVHMLTEEGAAIFSASGSREYWEFRVLFPDREAATATQEFCERWDLGVEIRSVYEMNHERHGRFGLTAQQSEILVIAESRGFFDIPQKAHMDDLAEELGISRQAVSERLRRAHKRLIQSTMAIGHEVDDERKDF